MNQKGLSKIFILVLIIAILGIGITAYFYTNRTTNPTEVNYTEDGLEPYERDFEVLYEIPDGVLERNAE